MGDVITEIFKLRYLLCGFIVNTNSAANAFLPFESHYFGFVSGDFHDKYLFYKFKLIYGTL
jgi:hypothetical protein